MQNDRPGKKRARAAVRGQFGANGAVAGYLQEKLDSTKPMIVAAQAVDIRKPHVMSSRTCLSVKYTAYSRSCRMAVSKC